MTSDSDVGILGKNSRQTFQNYFYLSQPTSWKEIARNVSFKEEANRILTLVEKLS